MVKRLFLMLLFLFLTYPLTANAQTDSGTKSATSKLEQQLQEIKSKRETVSTLNKNAKVNLKEQMRESVKLKKEEAKQTMEAKREQFKAKVQTIKEEKKKVLVERIDAKLASTNAKHTDRFMQVLSNLQIILDKVTEKDRKTEVQEAIDAAKSAVENQAAKTYTITILSETSLKTDVGTITSQLRKDLMATHKLVILAKQKLQKLKDSKTIRVKEATNSANL